MGVIGDRIRANTIDSASDKLLNFPIVDMLPSLS
jgi:hypothetical protein